MSLVEEILAQPCCMQAWLAALAQPAFIHEIRLLVEDEQHLRVNAAQARALLSHLALSIVALDIAIFTAAFSAGDWQRFIDSLQLVVRAYLTVDSGVFVLGQLAIASLLRILQLQRTSILATAAFVTWDLVERCLTSINEDASLLPHWAEPLVDLAVAALIFTSGRRNVTAPIVHAVSDRLDAGLRDAESQCPSTEHMNFRSKLASGLMPRASLCALLLEDGLQWSQEAVAAACCSFAGRQTSDDAPSSSCSTESIAASSQSVSADASAAAAAARCGSRIRRRFVELCTRFGGPEIEPIGCDAYAGALNSATDAAGCACGVGGGGGGRCLVASLLEWDSQGIGLDLDDEALDALGYRPAIRDPGATISSGRHRIKPTLLLLLMRRLLCVVGAPQSTSPPAVVSTSSSLSSSSASPSTAHQLVPALARCLGSYGALALMSAALVSWNSASNVIAVAGSSAPVAAALNPITVGVARLRLGSPDDDCDEPYSTLLQGSLTTARAWLTVLSFGCAEFAAFSAQRSQYDDEGTKVDEVVMASYDRMRCSLLEVTLRAADVALRAEAGRLHASNDVAAWEYPVSSSILRTWDPLRRHHIEHLLRFLVPVLRNPIRGGGNDEDANGLGEDAAAIYDICGIAGSISTTASRAGCWFTSALCYCLC